MGNVGSAPLDQTGPAANTDAAERESLENRSRSDSKRFILSSVFDNDEVTAHFFPLKGVGNGCRATKCLYGKTDVCGKEVTESFVFSLLCHE